MSHRKDPWRLFAIHRLEIALEPLVLLVIRRVLVAPVAADRTERARVGRLGLAHQGMRLVALEVGDERLVGRVCVVGLARKSDEVGRAVVEGIPEIGLTSTLFPRHAETVRVRREVSEGRKFEVRNKSVYCSPLISPLRWGTRIVGQIVLGGARPSRLALDEIRGDLIVFPLAFHTRIVMVARRDLQHTESSA